MMSRMAAAVLLAFAAPGVSAQGWLAAVDIPLNIAGLSVSPGQVVRFDEGDPTPFLIAAGLPDSVAPGALGQHPDDSLCWSPSTPTDLPDGQFARPGDVYCFSDATFTRIFRATEFGLDPTASVTSIGWDSASSLYLSFSVPLNIAGTLIRPNRLIVVDDGTLIPHSDTLTLPPRSTIKAGTFGEGGEFLLALDTPVLRTDGLASGLVLSVHGGDGADINGELATFFDQPARAGLTGVERLLAGVIEDLIFSDRFEAP